MRQVLIGMMLFSLGISSAFAMEVEHNPHHRSKKKTIMIKGKEAKKIFDALSQVEITTRSTNMFTMDIKKVSPLMCAKILKKEDTSKVYFRCFLKGKLTRSNRHHHRGHHRGHRSGHDHNHRN